MDNVSKQAPSKDVSGMARIVGSVSFFPVFSDICKNGRNERLIGHPDQEQQRDH